MYIQAVDALAVLGRVPPGMFFADGSTLASLRERVADLQASSTEMIQAADDGDRELTDAEVETIERNAAEVGRLNRQIAAREAIVAPRGDQAPGRRTVSNETAMAASGSRGSIPAQPKRDDPRGGFKSFGEFAMAVRRDDRNDNRLTAAATTYGNEGTGADGGFAVPPVFRTEIWKKVASEDNLMTRCASLTTSANSLTIPKDETTPWQTSGGILSYWEAEAATVAASKPALSMSTLRLAKLMALVPVSDELLDDAVGLESWLRAKAPEKMTAKINTAIIGGTGVGQPLGILTALTTGATISVAKETSQAADTIYHANIQKMWARLYAPCRRNAVWLINQDIEPQLNAMAFDPAATSKVPIYLPANGLSDSPYATLMGRPVVPVEACSSIGDQGDIILCDLNQYWVLTKGTDVQTDVSMHLYFDQGLQAFRFTFRMNGQPAWGSSITPQNGSNTRSWAVTLDAR